MEKFGRGEFHTVKYYGSTYAGPNLGYGLVMEYVGGGDLRSWLLRYNPSKPHLVSIDSSLRIVVKIPKSVDSPEFDDSSKRIDLPKSTVILFRMIIYLQSR